MPASPLLRPRVLLPLAALLAALFLGGWFLWQRLRERLPQPGSEAYEHYVEDFEVGSAALDSGILDQLAIDRLSQAVQTIPQEPAGWANLGIAYLRSNNPEKAAQALDRAHKLAPGNSEVLDLLGVLAEQEGRAEQANEYFRAALKAEPSNVRRLYRVSELLNREGKDDAEREQLLQQILEQRPTSLYTLADVAVLAARRKDGKTLRDTLARLEKLSGGWKEKTIEALHAALKEAKKEPLPEEALYRVLPLQNLLKQETGFARDAEAVNPRSSAVGTPFQTFLRLQPVRSTPAPPDLELTFADAPLHLPANIETGKAAGELQLFPLWLNARENPVVLQAGPREVRRIDTPGLKLPFPSGAKKVPPSLHGVLAVDWNNDERLDLVFAGAGGLEFYQHDSNGEFRDVTAKTKLPEKVRTADAFGVWAADVDLDGDLDVLVAPRHGGMLLLRNNFDGTFTPTPIFPGAEDVRCFAWFDIDNDGAADAVLLDAKGKLHVFMNRRSGDFARREAPEKAGPFAAVAVVDFNDDGVLDLVGVQTNGDLVALLDREKGKSWEVVRLAGAATKLPLVPGAVRLVALDLDNNGAVDLVLRTEAGGQAWLADGGGKFQLLPAALPAGTADVVSLANDRSFDLLGWSAEQTPLRKRTQPTRDYRWLRLRLVGFKAPTGDQRINAENLGGEVEMRAGTLIVKQPVERPVTSFGLGERKKPSVLRIVWTNGSPQFEFDKASDALIVVDQRLKGSCPFLFTHDGKGMVFVSDFCWSTPLGMYVNGQAGGSFLQTTDWVKIRGEQLAPRDGQYDVRVNANLWETHFLDHLALMVVDHPPGSEMHVDERFFLQPSKPQLFLSEPSRPVARAWDHHGQDVTDVVRAADRRYLDRAGRGTYQGVTADHWVEVDLGEDAPTQGPVYLLAQGWIHPSDSSLNVAMGQGTHPRPIPLTLETPDGKGGWKPAGPPLGFPAGKNKTCVIRLDGVAGSGVARRFRLRTNLEIFWDALHYARGLDASACVRQTLAPSRAELRYRGLVRMSQADVSSPELPHYDEVVCRTQHWRDLIGFHTRFGDVRELLAKIDDRYVIMNAGDEIGLRFAAPPPPPAGWKRDFVWVCDGWVKDGDLNTQHGKTVLPLPYHGMKDYEARPGRLEDDPVFRRFPQDWKTYHTRHVAPFVFERGLRPRTRPGR